MLKLRASAGPVRLVGARSHRDLAVQLRLDGYDLNQGMVALYGGGIYGRDCVHLLALLSTGSGAFNKLNGAVFRSRTLSRLLYPLLRCGPNLTLSLLERSKLS
jgi:hypothetical protein